MKQSYYKKCLQQIFLENGLDEELITLKPEDAYPGARIEYTCKSPCTNLVSRTPRNFKKKPLCDNCMPCKQRGPAAIKLNVFIKLLEDNGYTMIDSTGYVNSKSSVTVKDSLGNICKTDYNKFSGGHRSMGLAIEKKKNSVEDIKKRVEEAGFKWIEGTKYINKETKIKILCHCDREFEVLIGNLHEHRVGCPYCYMYNRKYDWPYIEGIADKYGCTIITEGNKYEGRDTLIEVICACGEEMLKNVRCFLKAPRCKGCSLVTRALTNQEKYGHKNYLASDIGKESIKEYYTKTYGEGITHNMQVEATRQKSQETCLKNFGVKCVLSTPEVREKAVAAHVEKWGDTPGNVPEIREKMKKTNNERLGVDYPLESKEVQKTVKSNNLKNYGNEVFIQSDTGKKLMMDKYGNEMFLQSETGKKMMMDKYGNEVYLQSDAGKKFMLDTYGAEYAMQIPQFFDKAMKSAFKLKSYEFPSGRSENIQGYENLCLDYLLFDIEIDETDIIVGSKHVPTVTYKIKGETTSRRYFMDAHIKSIDRGIEVKSGWTYFKQSEKTKNEAKWKAASYICTGGIDVYIFDKKGFICRRLIKNGKTTEVEFDRTNFPYKLKDFI